MNHMKDSKNDITLFHLEEKYLARAKELLEKRDQEEIDWRQSFEEMTGQYAKLLNHTHKLIKISDHAQKSLQKANSKIQIMADTDELTGLPNRRGSEKLLDSIIRKSRAFDVPIALFLLDVDHFKKINDSWGHSAGDKVLKELSELMKVNLRNRDILGRWGGEEFLMVLSETDLVGARILSEKIRDLIEKKPVEWEGEEIRVTMSMGGVMYDGKNSPDRNLDHADQALYRSKNTGRNRISFYEA